MFRKAWMERRKYESRAGGDWVQPRQLRGSGTSAQQLRPGPACNGHAHMRTAMKPSPGQCRHSLNKVSPGPFADLRVSATPFEPLNGMPRAFPRSVWCTTRCCPVSRDSPSAEPSLSVLSSPSSSFGVTESFLLVFSASHFTVKHASLWLLARQDQRQEQRQSEGSHAPAAAHKSCIHGGAYQPDAAALDSDIEHLLRPIVGRQYTRVGQDYALDEPVRRGRVRGHGADGDQYRAVALIQAETGRQEG